ncbi:MAG TPA: tRNA (adenosine(37)-N6)-threonylcarbamoyltransferase complex ATPase subunit type 1 TsaE [Gammaproteobacteria bacterium]|nr:tRNA (adenosine(37)-N6)-threonylcarbamoyltransferase complex ATPase subunit type 1 TsaE [Gammaproteobacteria bacterium]
MATSTIEIDTAMAMEALGGAIAGATTAELKVYLSGELGTGKTTLVRGYMRRLGYKGAVKSPTFTLVESYRLDDRVVHHFDLYRLEDPEELEYIGFDEYFETGADCLVEWPDRGRTGLPDPDIEIYLEMRGVKRFANLAADTEYGRRLLAIIENK